MGVYSSDLSNEGHIKNESENIINRFTRHFIANSNITVLRG